MKLSTATKVFVAFSVVTVFFTAILLASFWRSRTLYENVERLNRTLLPFTLQVTDLQSDIRNVQSILEQKDPLVLKRSLQVSQFIYDFPTRLDSNYRQLSKLVDNREINSQFYRRLNPSVQRIGTQITGFNKKFRGLDSKLSEAHKPLKGNTREELINLQQRLKARAGKINQNLETLTREVQQIADQSLSRVNQRYRYSLYGFAGLTGLGILASIFVLYSVLAALRPLEKLTAAIRRVGEGDYAPLDAGEESWLSSDEIETLAREFNRMLSQLKERDRQIKDQHQKILKSERLATIGEMTSLITHEIRNPLSSISLNVEMLEDLLASDLDLEDHSEVREILTSVNTEVDRLKNITEEYLDYARMPAPERAEIDLAETLENLVTFHVPEWQQKDIEVSLDVPGTAVRVDADEDQIRRACLNILQNAVEAIEESEKAGRVEVSLEERDDRIEIQISDNGPGISDEMVDELFEAFVTTKQRGSGLGLTMTKQIVEAHEGDIYAESDNAGTEFTIILPHET